jgi:hypothetical protein
VLGNANGRMSGTREAAEREEFGHVKYVGVALLHVFSNWLCEVSGEAWNYWRGPISITHAKN